MPVLVHKLAVELKGKSQDSVPVFVLYIKNAKALQMESLQNAAPFWRERGTASRWLVVESRFLYVGIRESKRMLHIELYPMSRTVCLTSLSTSLVFVSVYCIHLL